MSVTPTIRVKSDIPGCKAGLDINAFDFNPDIHEEWMPEPAAPPETVKPETKPAKGA